MFPMKTGFSGDDALSTPDKTLIISIADAFVQEVVRIIQIISAHHAHIYVVKQQLMLKCIKFAVLSPLSIGTSINQLLEVSFMESKQDEKAGVTDEVRALAQNVMQTYNKHNERLQEMEQKYAQVQASEPNRYLIPSEAAFVTRPLVKQLLGDYFDGVAENMHEEEEEEEEYEGDEGEEGEEDESMIEEEEEDTQLTCTCEVCSGVMAVGAVHDFNSEQETNPFIKAIMRSLTNLEAKFGQKEQ